MKITPEQVIPPKVQFTKSELIGLWEFLRNEKGFNHENYKTGSWHHYSKEIQSRLRTHCIYDLDLKDADTFWLYPYHSHGGIGISLKEFQDYCKRSGIANGEKYQIS